MAGPAIWPIPGISETPAPTMLLMPPIMLDVLPLHCTARRLFVAFVDALTARDFVLVTDALDAWERSGEMEPALWVLTGETGETDETDETGEAGEVEPC